MGFIAGVFEFIPLAGPLVVALMAAILAILHAGPFNAFLVLLFLGVLRIVHDYFVYPRLIGQGIHLHPLAVIFAILAGEKLAASPAYFGDSAGRDPDGELSALARTSRQRRVSRIFWNRRQLPERSSCGNSL
jgi:hypothetical protein